MGEAFETVFDTTLDAIFLYDVVETEGGPASGSADGIQHTSVSPGSNRARW